MCNNDVAMFFLMLASEITRIVFGFERKFSKILLRLQRWAFLTSLSLQFTVRKEIWSGKVSTNQKLEESFFYRAYQK